MKKINRCVNFGIVILNEVRDKKNGLINTKIKFSKGGY
jgi:hypothetical protein